MCYKLGKGIAHSLCGAYVTHRSNAWQAPGAHETCFLFDTSDLNVSSTKSGNTSVEGGSEGRRTLTFRMSVTILKVRHDGEHTSVFIVET